MFIFFMSCFFRPYLASKSSSKMASSNVLLQSRPMLKTMGLLILPTLRCHITGGTDDWHDIPTSASFEKPRSSASSMASGLADDVERDPAVAMVSCAVAASPG